MKRNLFLTFIIVSALAGGCNSSNSGSHDEQDHETEHHDHEHDSADHNHSGEIPLEDKEAEKLGVRTLTTSRRDFSETLHVGGVVERASDGEFIVSASRSGRFSPSRLLEVGSHVSMGQTLGNISPGETEGGDPVAIVRARLQAAEKEVERLRPLAASGAVSRAEFQRAEVELTAARAESGGNVSGTVCAPGTGIVTSVMARRGEFVERGQSLAVISRNTQLTLRADVPVRHASIARSAVTANFRQEGMDNTVSLSDFSGRRLGDGTSSSSEGYIPVSFSFTNNGTAIPGAYAEIWLKGRTRSDVIYIPKEALVEIQGVQYVFEKIHDGKYLKRRVSTGPSDGQNIEIISGLEEGKEIVTEGARVIRMAEISHIAPPAHTHNH